MLMNSCNVPFVNLAAQFATLKKELTDAFVTIGESGHYVGGEIINSFEGELAKLAGTTFAVAVANGTDALQLSMKALNIGPGDEVVTTPNSFIATAGSINAVGAKIRFAEVNSEYNIDPNKIQDAITEKTKAIIPVHLTGNPADMDPINAIAKKHNIFVIEDAAQAINASYKGRKVGSLGNMASFSLHPLKNFHLMGDAGFISTDNEELYTRLKKLQNHGLKNRDEAEFWGYNSRCDALQAAIGLQKIPFFNSWTERFREIANKYHQCLENHVECPVTSPHSNPVFHNFVIQVNNRDNIMAELSLLGVETKVHYPIPLHLMHAAKDLGYQRGDFPLVERQSERILSLPIYPELTDEQVEHVINSLIKVIEKGQ